MKREVGKNMLSHGIDSFVEVTRQQSKELKEAGFMRVYIGVYRRQGTCG